MAPVLHVVSDAMSLTLAPTSQGFGTKLELALITASVALTILVHLLRSKLPGKAFATFSFSERNSFALVLYLVIACVSIAALTLGWQRRISLEALVAVSFALVSTLADFSARVLVFRRAVKFHWYAYWRGYRIHTESLWNTDELCYLRIENPCHVVMRKNAHRSRKCKGEACHAQIYCVYLGRSVRFSLLNAFVTRLRSIFYRGRALKDQKVFLPLHARHEGCYQPCNAYLDAHLRHHAKHCIDLCTPADEPRPLNVDFKKTSLFALSLVDEPYAVFLDTKCQVFVILNLIMEICVIGELAYFVRGEYLDDQLQNMVDRQHAKKWTRLKGRSALVHRRVIERLQLWDWKPSNFKHFTADGAVNKESQSQLFYILLEKSCLLHRRPVANTVGKDPAMSIVRAIKECELDAKEFEGFLYDKVDQWLISWGCDPKELHRSRRPPLSWPYVSPVAESYV